MPCRDTRLAAGRMAPRKEDPVRIPGRNSEPEPDVSVARGTFKTYARRHPNEAEIALIVEVADTSLVKDLRTGSDLRRGGHPHLLDRQPGSRPGRSLLRSGSSRWVSLPRGLSTWSRRPGHHRRARSRPDRGDGSLAVTHAAKQPSRPGRAARGAQRGDRSFSVIERTRSIYEQAMHDAPPFTLYRTEERREELLRLGLSQPIVRLALFDLPHPLFSTRCEDIGPPQPESRTRQPSGSPVAYLWCFQRHHRLVTGVRVRGSRWIQIMSRLPCRRPRLEFILFRPDAIAAGHVVMARSEQGLLASIFSGLIADQHLDRDMLIEDCGDLPFPQEEWESHSRKELEAAAKSVGFRYLSEIEAFWRTHGDRDDYYDLLYAYTRSIL